MMRPLMIALGLATVSFTFTLAASNAPPQNFASLRPGPDRLAPSMPQGYAGLPTWMVDLFEGQRRRPAPALVTLQTPSATQEAVVLLGVSTIVPGVRAFCIDVDLNHDGVFAGRGELAYAEGRFDPTQSATVRVHGLVAGTYQARARFRQAGREVVSAVQDFEVLPPRDHLPVSFEPNVGQADPAVLFLGRARGHTVFATADETVLVGRGSVQRFRLLGANSWVRPVGAKKLPGIANYFIGNDPSKWRTDIATYQEVVAREVYPGIDLVYHSSQGQLEYDFRVAPGADPSMITLDFPDVDRLSIDVDGLLIMHLPNGQQMQKSAPVMYQGVGPRVEAVKGSWVIQGRRQVGYSIAEYDRDRELIIDPILWATFLGGSANEDNSSCAVDPAGNVHVVADTQSVNFPV